MKIDFKNIIKFVILIMVLLCIHSIILSLLGYAYEDDLLRDDASLGFIVTLLIDTMFWAVTGLIEALMISTFSFGLKKWGVIKRIFFKKIYFLCVFSSILFQDIHNIRHIDIFGKFLLVFPFVFILGLIIVFLYKIKKSKVLKN